MKSVFSLPARVLHWAMAAMIVSMLFIGVGMVSSVSARHAVLVAVHKPCSLRRFFFISRPRFITGW
ncbi:hypothetical protein BGX87_24260 [Burkholderia ubonensis]|nr:hypothetical protein BGX87_24260 [Burkholderia ubonensis]